VFIAVQTTPLLSLKGKNPHGIVHSFLTHFELCLTFVEHTRRLELLPRASRLPAVLTLNLRV